MVSDAGACAESGDENEIAIARLRAMGQIQVRRRFILVFDLYQISYFGGVQAFARLA